MKINYRILIICLVFFLSCESKTTEKDEYADIKQKIIGIWGSPEKEPVFYISSKSIYSDYWKDSCSYFFIKDTFFVMFNDRDTATPFGKMSVFNDTLSWIDRDGMTTYAFRCQ